MMQVEKIFSWSPWWRLEECWRGAQTPKEPGLYQIRRVGQDELDYIGQTSGALRKRLGMLTGILGSQMPYSAPHTASPALWALRHSSNCDFEVSVLIVQGTEQWRLGLEALAISLHRQKFGKSPTVNFGRMIIGYQKSSNYTRKLVETGKLFRGSITSKQDRNHLPGIAPLGSLIGDPQSLDWCGHNWSNWISLARLKNAISGAKLGLYRIRSSSEPNLLYIGEGKIKDRLCQHLKNAQQPKNKQSYIFANAGSLEASWVCNDLWSINQRKELENDLIASHLLMTETIPTAQFLGNSK